MLKKIRNEVFLYATSILRICCVAIMPLRLWSSLILPYIVIVKHFAVVVWLRLFFTQVSIFLRTFETLTPMCLHTYLHMKNINPTGMVYRWYCMVSSEGVRLL